MIVEEIVVGRIAKVGKLVLSVDVLGMDGSTWNVCISKSKVQSNKDPQPGDLIACRIQVTDYSTNVEGILVPDRVYNYIKNCFELKAEELAESQELFNSYPNEYNSFPMGRGGVQ